MEFRITDKSITSYEDDDVLHIVGIANTGQEDLAGDVLTNDALMNICEQAVNHNLHLDHDTSMEGLLGPITSARLVDEGVEIHATIVNGEQAGRIKNLLENGVKLGLSVSGVATNTAHDRHTITEWDLTEISITPLPCDQGTMGSVCIAKSFAEVIKQVKQNKTEEIAMEDKSMAEEYVTIEKVIELINEAFNERREEYLETIREELKNEYDAQLKEIQERLDTLTKEEEEDDAVVSNPAGKPADEDVNAQLEQMEAEAEKGAVAEQKATQTEEEEKEEASEEEDDDEKEDIVKSIESIIQKKFDEIFTNKKHADLDFKYKEEEQKSVETEEEKVVKKAYTPHELAQILSKQ